MAFSQAYHTQRLKYKKQLFYLFILFTCILHNSKRNLFGWKRIFHFHILELSQFHVHVVNDYAASILYTSSRDMYARSFKVSYIFEIALLTFAWILLDITLMSYFVTSL